MSQQSITNAGKIAVGMAIVAALLSITATVITYIRFGKINVVLLFGGLIIPLVVISMVMMRKNRKH